jgi:hypothetical protein
MMSGLFEGQSQRLLLTHIKIATMHFKHTHLQLNFDVRCLLLLLTLAGR